MSINPFDKYCGEYDAWFEKNAEVYKSELIAVKKLLPECGLGLEIGVGTARFAEPLGVKVGVDPAMNALRVARSRGIFTVRGFGEELPFQDESFDYLLLVTAVCFLDNPEETFKECRRVLRSRGSLVTAIIDRESELGRRYEQKRHTSQFYRSARFYSVEEIKKMLESLDFTVEEYYQTLCSLNASKKKIERPKQGFGRGSFAVILARKV